MLCLLICFNPCYLGNTIRSTAYIWSYEWLSCVSILVILEIQSDRNNFILPKTSTNEFQSLLSWKYNQIYAWVGSVYGCQRVSILVILEIQSDRYNPTVCCAHRAVSILVILEIQSDLFMNENNNMIHLLSFNPCYLGNTIRSHKEYLIEGEDFLFQSLLSWKYNQILAICTWTFFPGNSVFQSLLSWKYNQICPLNHHTRSPGVVSILVILEIQSDLNELGTTLLLFLSFNPCYLGNTIRSVYLETFQTFRASFNPCYLGNTIRSILYVLSNEGVKGLMFQSLLSWKYNQILGFRPNNVWRKNKNGKGSWGWNTTSYD